MTNETLYKVIGNIDEKYIDEAKKPMKKNRIVNFKTWGALAACLCMVFLGTTTFYHLSNSKPHPDYIQVVNPVLEVSSVEEMEKYLDFDVPSGKQMDSHTVYPEMIIWKKRSGI